MSWKGTAALLALSFFGVGSLVYILLKHDEKEEDFCLFEGRKAVIDVKIPKEFIGVVIGRGGNTIREIETMSGTKLQIKDDTTSDDFKICHIRGKPDKVQYAESLIHEVIVGQPLIETFEMYVPNKICGRIIGKNGENIRHICRTSNAKIILENLPVVPSCLERKLIIKGTSEQIGIARQLVEEKIEEEANFQNEIEMNTLNRSPRNQNKYLLADKGESTERDVSQRREKLEATGSNGFLEVYVSSVESPDRFWVQVRSPSTVNLDKLNEDMTEYYSKSENRKSHVLKEVKRGQIVATPFSFDEKWYRAEVMDIEYSAPGSLSHPADPKVTLYYVDYGDSGVHRKSTLFELRTDFLRLRFQAIECMLAKVKPRDSTWTPEATDFLSDLTHVAMWTPLTAKIDSYVERPTHNNRGGSPIPCIELLNTNEEKTVNIAKEMVEKGFAEWKEKKETVKQPESRKSGQKKGGGGKKKSSS